ncbi:MAG: MbnP family protein [Bacteroidia bacterium]
MKNNIIRTAIISFITISMFSSCKKDETPVSTEEMLSFHLHRNIGTAEAQYGVEYQTAGGRKFTVEDYRFYISNIVLIKQDGSTYPLTGKVILAGPASMEYELGKVPVGNYKGFTFMMGLDSATNHTDPAIYSSGNPLSVQTPSIHWDWNSGYIFFKVEGKVDTTLAANGTADYDYLYHIGMDDLKRTIDFSTGAFSVTSGSSQEIHLEFDLLEALSNVDMRTENLTHTMDNFPLADKIANNWQSAWSLE